MRSRHWYWKCFVQVLDAVANKITRLGGAGIVVCAAMAPPALFAGGEGADFPLYVGRGVCLQCHAPKHDAEPCTLRPIPKHLTAYETLFKPQARDIAAISGVSGPPQHSRVCLVCHSTGADDGPRWMQTTFKVQEGVQCEECHGAGSKHVDAHRARRETAGLDRTNGARLAEDARELKEQWIQRGDRQRCGPCHVEKPSHREVLEFGFSLSEADARYKTPVGLAVSVDGRRLYVVCQHSDSVVVVDPVEGRIVREIAVGRRPHGIAIGPDGRLLYVTNRLSDSVSVVDAGRGEVIREFGVGRDPHGVLVGPNGNHLYVLNTGEDSISVIDLTSYGKVNRLSAGRGPWALALGPDRRFSVVTSVRPNPARFRDPHDSELTVLDVETGLVTKRVNVPDANMLQGIAFLPGREVALFTLTRTKSLVPITRLEQGWTITNGIGVLQPDGRVDQVLLDEPNRYFADPMDLAVSPDGTRALVVSGGCNEVAVLDVTRLLETIESFEGEQRQNILPNHLGVSGQFVIKRLPVGANPRAVVYSPEGRHAYVANTLDDSITVIDTLNYSPLRVIGLDGPESVSEIRLGERLFHSANITFGQQFSCRGCHPDGHVNGLTFDIEADGIGRHPVDNRTLRGILDTPPFKWEGTNPSLARQCGPRLAVFFTRLAPFSPPDLKALVRYMCTIEQSPNPYRRFDGLTPTQRRGKRVFERTHANDGTPLPRDRQCAYCHSGAYLTNRELADVGSSMWFDADTVIEPEDLFDTDEYGELGTYYLIDAGVETEEFDVAHLNNIFESPPYLHNGAAETLEEIWTRFNMVNRHGATADLTRQQFNDLIAYLKSL